MTKENKKKMPTNDIMIVSLWWIGTIFSLIFMLGGLVQLYRGLIESDLMGLIVSLIMTLMFYGIYTVCVKGIEKRTGSKMGYKPIIYMGGFFVGIMLLGVLIGFLSGMMEPSFEEEQEELYNKNIQNIKKEIPQSNEDALYKDKSEIVLTENSTYTERLIALQDFAYGEEISCTYPEEQVGRTCCTRSLDVPEMCNYEYDEFISKYDLSEDITEEGQTYNLNGRIIEIPWGYFMIEDVSIGGNIVELMLISNDELGNYYEIRVNELGVLEGYSHKEMSYLMFNMMAQYFNSTISDITFYKNGDWKLSYFDYYIVDDLGGVVNNRIIIGENNDEYIAINYIGSNKEYINEANLIADSLK